MREQVGLEKDFTSVTVHIEPELAEQKYILGYMFTYIIYVRLPL